ITVPNIEKSENALRDACNETEKSFNEASRALGQAKDELEKLWTAENKPCNDAIGWAALESQKDTSKLQANIAEVDKLILAFQNAETALSSLDKAEADEKKALEELVAAEAKLKEAESRQTQQNAELLSLLREAKTYIDKRVTLTQCPVCERKDIDSAKLLKRLGERIDEMAELDSLVSNTKTKKRQTESKKSVADQARKDFCQKTKTLAILLKSCALAEVKGQNLEWDNFNTLLSEQEPSDTVEQQARQFWKTMSELRQPLKNRKEIDQKSLIQHNAIKGQLETLQEKIVQATSQEDLLAKLQLALKIVSKERKDYVENILDSISVEVERLYAKLHPREDIGKIRFYLKPNAIGSLEFDAQFHNASALPPQAYYSESHLDTLGICVFLALAKHFKTERTIVVLDDVLTSVDGPHLERFMTLLHEEAEHFNQMIVTTHYRLWRDRYRWAKGSTANTQIIELGPWTLQNGLYVGEFMTAIAELEKIIGQPNFNRESAASKAGVILESLLDFITLKYRCAIPRNARNEYTLGDLASGVDSKLAKELRTRKPVVAAGQKLEIQLKPLINAATASQWIRNCVGCHFNLLGSEVPDVDVRSFCQNVMDLSSNLICAFCETLPTRRPSGSYWQCKCGELELYPLIYPGADPGTVDDEA
ncbi:hypothetical protein DWB58_30085, partial [candidate division KSB1 bacterium]|nr:hypothetical protein [candidate division KSB1 bacterium]